MMVLCLCLAATGQAEAMPDAIADAIVNSGVDTAYDVLDCLIVDDSWAACALSVQGQSILYILEYADGGWNITVSNDKALYPNPSLSLVRYTAGGWRYDGFLVHYNTHLGQWPYFSFDRLDHGEWALHIFMCKDSGNLWRIDRDDDTQDRWVFTNELGDVSTIFEAFHPFETDLAIFDARHVPISLQAAEVTLGNALIPLSQNLMQPVVQATPTPLDAWAPTGLPEPGPTPHWEPLQGKPVSFPADKRYAVYSGPGTEYLRGDTGNAFVSTNGPVTLYGVEDGYALIEYTISSRIARFGYINAKYLPDPEETNALAFYRYPILLDKGTVLTDDPSHSGRELVRLDRRMPSEYLVGYDGHWSYIETLDSEGAPVRGFVPEQQIVFGTE